MYTYDDARRHIDRCNAAAHDSPEALFRAAFMTVGSIRLLSNVFWRRLDHEWAAFERGGTDALSPQFRFSYKKRCLDDLWDQREALHSLVKFGDHALLHDTLCAMHGLRAIKAGLVTKMATGRLVCFESVHCNLRGMDIREFSARWNRKNGPAQYRTYVAGFDPVAFWRDWCLVTAARDNMDARAISEAHANFVECGSTGLPDLLGHRLREDPVLFHPITGEAIYYG